MAARPPRPVPLVDPLPPGVDRRPSSARRAGCHGVVVDLHLDRLGCRGAAPRPLRRRHRARLEGARPPGHVDAGRGLDRALGGPAASDPVGVDVLRSVVTFSSTTHFVAETYPYSPGTTMRTGKPCSTGSGSPFMPTASRRVAPGSCSAVERRAARSSRRRSWRAPCRRPPAAWPRASRSRIG